MPGVKYRSAIRPGLAHINQEWWQVIRCMRRKSVVLRHQRRRHKAPYNTVLCRAISVEYRKQLVHNAVAVQEIFYRRGNSSRSDRRSLLSRKAHGAAWSPFSLALSQTPVYTAGWLRIGYGASASPDVPVFALHRFWTTLAFSFCNGW